MTKTTTLWLICVTALLHLPPAWAQLTLDGNNLDTPRLRWTLAPSGLPAQLVIKPAPSEIPRPLRGKEIPDAELQAIGRGPQWRAPLRLVAMIGGQPLVLEPVKPAQAVLADGVVTTETQLQAGALLATLKLRYAEDGSLLADLTFGGQDLMLDQLDLVLDLAAGCDTAIAGSPLAATPEATAAISTDILPGEGLAWRNLPDQAAGLQVNQPGVLPHFFLGTGDRGFTWLTPGGPGFAIDAKLPSMVVMRDKLAMLTWRSTIVNTPTSVKTARQVSFALLVHPAKFHAANFRQDAWLPWTGVPATPALTLAARQPGQALLRADAATVHAAMGNRAQLVGPAGGNALLAKTTLADSFGIGLFRYLAAPHTGLTVQLRPNAASLVTAGQSSAIDHMALGRALLHDIGVDMTGLSQKRQAARVLQVLDEFGYFKDDGETEFIPYWRSGEVVRYGEPYQPGDNFEIAQANPMARALVSVFVRPAAKDAKKLQAMMVVVNESDHPMREQFYILQPARLFGGPNKVTPAGIINTWDFSQIPPESDWRKSTMIGSALSKDDRLREVLMDLTDVSMIHGITRAEGMEIYGLLFVPPHSLRLIYGAGSF
jgi:hypothetical protein